MKEIYSYLSKLGFDLTIPGPNHFAGFLQIAEEIELKTLYLQNLDNYENVLMMDIFITPTTSHTIIAQQQIENSNALRQHLLNSCKLNEYSPDLFQKVLRTHP